MRMTCLPRCLFGFALSLSVALPSPAAAFFGGASEFTQLLNNAELIGLAGQSGVQIENQLTQIAQQVEQIQNQIRIYENMLQNTLTLPEEVWGEVENDLNRLRAIVGEGQGIAFSMSDLDDVLQQRFQSYAQLQDESLAGEDFSSAYQNWSDTTRDTIAGTLKAANWTAEEFSSEEATMERLRAMSGTSVGQMQALQVGHQIATQQVAQMQKLRGLVSQQMTMMGTWYHSEQAAKDLAQTRREDFFSAPDSYPTSGGQQMEPRF